MSEDEQIADDLAWSEGQQKRAARYIEEHLGPDTHKAGVLADSASEAVVGGSGASVALSPGALGDWDVRDGLAHRMGEWETAFTRLRGRLERELGALRHTGVLFQGNEAATYSSFLGVGGQSAISDHAGDHAPPWTAGHPSPPPYSRLSDL
ncbi:hypothetical protein GCM10023347_03410 [Streptomyces chumphonensis]|uniref:Uncharacterized protein n=1 Tax=Streptomyces chumphonensis TaxID=1214925 RepID=A0A927F277_9ACTN|nr:hypothetical protein [Streptomyces chumphonensis]MBD3934225.1 hypothetical protein [Streptomyces chumphonensis]